MARDVDGELDRSLTKAAASPRGGLVLVTGASTASKTRALAAALARTLPRADAGGPTRGRRPAVSPCLAQRQG